MNYFEQKVLDYKRGAIPPLVILDKKVPRQWNTYSGIKRMSTKCVTYHNSGMDGIPAWNSDNYIRNYPEENPDKKSWTGTIDYDGSIWKHAAWDDLVWASGTYPHLYTELGAVEYNSRPYDYDIPFEFTTVCKDGEELWINMDQLVAGSLIGIQMCFLFDLRRPSEGGFRRHGDFAKNKQDCPKYLMDSDNWNRFLNMSEDFYNIEKMRRG